MFFWDVSSLFRQSVFIMFKSKICFLCNYNPSQPFSQVWKYFYELVWDLLFSLVPNMKKRNQKQKRAKMENIARITNNLPDCHCCVNCHWHLKLALSGSCLCVEIFYPESFTVLKKNIFREAWNNLLRPLSKSKLGFHELALPKLSISVKRNLAHFSAPCFSQKIVARLY